MSRDKDQTTTAPHQPLLSSLVVRPSESTGGGGASDYEPGEVRRDPPPYRSDRFSDDHASNVASGKNLCQGRHVGVCGYGDIFWVIFWVWLGNLHETTGSVVNMHDMNLRHCKT